MWKDIQVSNSDLYPWNESSTYIQHPPFFQDLDLQVPHVKDIQAARLLVLLRDSITTDHISPAGNIASNSPAGGYLQEHGVAVRDFNSYGSRRGNDRVMTRGTFANIRLKNQLVPGVEGGVTQYYGESAEVMSIYAAAMKYASRGIPSIVIAGKEYGAGSSRDWAAKGTLLLGVKAVIAESFERIHRSNLVGMGVLPLQFEVGQNADSLGLKGDELFDIRGLDENLLPQGQLTVTARKPDGQTIQFKVKLLLNTPVEVNYYRNGGILHTVLRNMLK
jgi:aconitate hydratase